jgi:hypothetical protein
MSTVQETLELLKSIQAQGNNEILAKSITTAHGLQAYDLQAPAKNHYPVNTPLRNVIPRRGGGIGLATNWKVVKSIAGSGFDAMGWVPEGQRSGRMSMVTANKSASFVTLGEEDQITYEAVHAGVGFEDLQATMRMRLLQKLMMKQEHAILGGNSSLTLPTPGTPTLSAGSTGGTLPAATYSVSVVALTYEGYRGSSLAEGIAISKTISGADGQTFTLNGGSSAASTAATQAVTLGQKLSCTTPAVRGAIGYAWFVGVAGSEKLERITTINSAVFSVPLTGSTRQALTAITGDHSANPDLAYDGLMTSALITDSGAYVKALATGTAGVGTTLTPSGRGSVVEIDEMFREMWDTHQVSPEVLYVHSQELKTITDCVLTGPSSAPLLRYNADAGGGNPYNMMAGGVVDYYFNPYSANGGYKIPIKIHPFLPPGTIVGWTGTLPPQYQSNNTPHVVEVIERKSAYSIDWPLRTRQQETGVYFEEVMAVYFPAAMSVLTNIAPNG